MQNTQPRERLIQNPQGGVDIVDVWQTIQGEGPFVGTPAVFVRLAGCNLDCPLCDTDYTSKREGLFPDELLSRVVRIQPPAPKKRTASRTLVVLTGGEPFRQNLLPLVEQLTSAGYRVQIETNGSLYDDEFIDCYLVSDPDCAVSIVCSPKALVAPKLWPYILAVKYVVDTVSGVDDRGLPNSTLGNKCGVSHPPDDFIGDIFIQPADVQEMVANYKNNELAIQVCIEFGYRLCLQTHKIVGLS